MADYWEPWTPEVGQRVRVRISPECDYCDIDEDGMTAVVELIDEIDPTLDYTLNAHRWWVILDVPPDGYVHRRNYAAIELEPLPLVTDGGPARE